jgi:hypothetical protein
MDIHMSIGLMMHGRINATRILLIAFVELWIATNTSREIMLAAIILLSFH